MKINSNHIDDDIKELMLVLAYIDDARDMDSFMSDLLTDTELQTAAMRWRAVRMLSVGISYTKIVKATGMSSATVARLSKLAGLRGGGFKAILIKMHQ